MLKESGVRVCARTMTVTKSERGKKKNVIVIKETNIIINKIQTQSISIIALMCKMFQENWHLFECTGIRREKPSDRKFKPLSSLRHTTIIMLAEQCF